VAVKEFKENYIFISTKATKVIFMGIFPRLIQKPQVNE